MNDKPKPPFLLAAAGIAVLTISATSNITFSQVRGVPYSAVEVTETTQILQDGNRITRKTITKMYRDSEGRTRQEMFPNRTGPQGTGDDSPAFVTIQDPVAGLFYTLDTRTRTARRREVGAVTNRRPSGSPGTQAQPTTGTTTVSPGGGGVGAGGSGTEARRTPPQARAGSFRANAKSEPLGDQVIEDFNTQGTRTTMTIPAGSVGNEQPLVVVTERWISPELGISLLTKRDDPRMGQSVSQVTNIQLDEPSPDLFTVPPDYTVEVEPAPVPIPTSKP